ncbi:Metalloprotease MmpA [bioreactor metagenome]|uniref:Metalloprotease MmpA n=1 Tax=bioreactor metagenome TaxID=1076179 RepID=A0A644Z635_9ZZZZ|nr:RIP metalloprotease RseP [Erysipelotrichaceae bacterium]
MTIIYFIIMLGVIVLIHELGHLITAKLFGVYCHEFSFGFGPRLLAKKGKETTYSIRALPLGGFVRMAGEEALEGDAEVPLNRTLNGIAPLKRIIILLSGIFMNIILAIVAFSILYGILGYYVQYPAPVIAGVTADSPASEAGFMTGDEIVSVTYSDGVVIHPETFYTIVQYLQAYSDEATYLVSRNGTAVTIKATPVYDAENQLYYLGLTMNDIQYLEVTPFNALYYGADYTWQTTKDIFNSLGNLIQGRGLQNLSGPVAIFQITDETISSAETFQEGLFYFLNIIAVLSLNVGIFNLLPVPMLDGGRVVLTSIELITKKPISKKIEYALINASAVLIMLLFVLIMWNDISKLFS